MDICDSPIDRIIGLSHYEAARSATRHLGTRGYEKLAFLGARMDPRTRKRFSGFRDQANALNSFDDRRVLTTQSASTAQLGAALFGELIGQNPDLDAVFCNNDDLALGAFFECQRRGIQIGTDIGICGFNDLNFCAAASPTITSVETFRHQQGVMAARSFLESEPSLPKITDLGFELCPRASTQRA
jgi:LacI family gluconate utilization system Gnt-I transcriptional repressor